MASTGFPRQRQERKSPKLRSKSVNAHNINRSPRKIRALSLLELLGLGLGQEAFLRGERRYVLLTLNAVNILICLQTGRYNKQNGSSNSPVAAHQNVSNNRFTCPNVPSPDFSCFSQSVEQELSNIEYTSCDVSSNQALEEPKSSQTSEANLAAVESNHDDDSGLDHDSDHDDDSGHDDSGLVGIESASERTWNLLFESRQQRYEIEMANLKDEHQEKVTTLRSEHEEEVQGLISKHQDETKAANSRKLLLQKRVKHLTQEKATLGGDLESNVVTMRQAISAAKESEAKYEEMKAKYAAIDELRQKNEEQTGIISSLELEKAREATAKIALVEKQQELETKLKVASEVHQTLSAGLAKNQVIASQFRVRNIQLYAALDTTPQELANVRGVIELKDQMLSDAEKRAKDCFDALTELRESSDHDKALAAREIARLEEKLMTSERSNAILQESKSGYQRSTEEVFAMLNEKIFQTELTAAMESHLKVVVSDNENLESLAILQHDTISDLDNKLVSLEAEITEFQKTSAAKDQCVAELENQARVDNLELARLRLEVDALPLEMRSSMDRKIARIQSLREEVERLEQALQKVSDEREEILKAGLDERALVHTNLQKQEFQRLTSDNEKLKDDLSWSEGVAGQNASQILLLDLEKAKAEGIIKNLQGQLNEQLGLPATTGVAELVLLCREPPETGFEEPRPRETESESDDEMF